MTHDALLYAAIHAQNLRPQTLSPWRLEDNGASPLLVADVKKRVSNDLVKIGEIWIGGDGPGGISGYLNDNLEEGEDFDSVRIDDGTPAKDVDAIMRNVRSGRQLGVDLVSLIDRMLAATEHKLTLVGFELGIDGQQNVYSFTISGREGVYTAWSNGEVFNPEEVPVTPRYADGESAMEDLGNLTGRFQERWSVFWETYGMDDRLRAIGDLVRDGING